MRGIFDLVRELQRRADAARAARVAAEAEARSLLADGSRREALRVLREREDGADAAALRSLKQVRAAVLRLANEPPKADVATRLHYGDS